MCLNEGGIAVTQHGVCRIQSAEEWIQAIRHLCPDSIEHINPTFLVVRWCEEDIVLEINADFDGDENMIGLRLLYREQTVYCYLDRYLTEIMVDADGEKWQISCKDGLCDAFFIRVRGGLSIYHTV